MCETNVPTEQSTTFFSGGQQLGALCMTHARSNILNKEAIAPLKQHDATSEHGLAALDQRLDAVGVGHAIVKNDYCILQGGFAVVTLAERLRLVQEGARLPQECVQAVTYLAVVLQRCVVEGVECFLCLV